MEVIIYNKYEKNGNITFARSIQDHTPHKDVKNYCALAPLKKKLLSANSSGSLLVIFARTIDDLLDIYFMEHLLYSYRIAVILPDREKESRALGYRLRASILGFYDDNFMEIVNSLKRFLMESTTTKQRDTRGLQLSTINGNEYAGPRETIFTDSNNRIFLTNITPSAM